MKTVIGVSLSLILAAYAGGRLVRVTLVAGSTAFSHAIYGK